GPSPGAPAPRRPCHAGVGFIGPRDAPLPDPGALADPLVRRVEDLRELVVRHHTLRRVATRSLELRNRTLHRAALPPANSAPMSWSRWLSTMCAATRTALTIARAGEAP